MLIIIIYIIHQSSLDNEDYNSDNDNSTQDYKGDNTISIQDYNI